MRTVEILKIIISYLIFARKLLLTFWFSIFCYFYAYTCLGAQILKMILNSNWFTWWSFYNDINYSKLWFKDHINGCAMVYLIIFLSLDIYIISSNFCIIVIFNINLAVNLFLQHIPKDGLGEWSILMKAVTDKISNFPLECLNSFISNNC